jgi:LSD1 subclass zinc finger protein
MVEQRCGQCGHLLPLESFANRVRCDWCGADNRVQRAGESTATGAVRADPAERMRAVLAETDPELRLREVAERLKRALPDCVETTPGKRITSVRVRVGEYQFELVLEADRIAGRRSRVVRGTVVAPVMVDDTSLPALLAKDLDELGVLERFLDG